MTRDQATGTFALAVMGAICAVIYAFPPGQYNFYPVCPIYHSTGWLCPGCGATRAVYALLHGDLLAAWAFNPLLVLLMPLITALAIWQLVSLLRTEKFAAVTVGNGPTFAMLAMTVMFGLVRNLT